MRELADRAGAGARAAVVARELTKRFEEVRRGTVESLSAYYNEAAPRGEVVLLVGGAEPSAPDESALRAEAASLRATGLSVRDVVAALVQRGAPRNLAYRMAREAEEQDAADE